VLERIETALLLGWIVMFTLALRRCAEMERGTETQDNA
jgi:hypothetical protein